MKPIFAAALLLLLPACGQKAVQPIPVVAEARICPELPVPPKVLTEPVKRPSFLPTI